MMKILNFLVLAVCIVILFVMIEKINDELRQVVKTQVFFFEAESKAEIDRRRILELETSLLVRNKEMEDLKKLFSDLSIDVERLVDQVIGSGWIDESEQAQYGWEG
jgi:hypothetical protein